MKNSSNSNSNSQGMSILSTCNEQLPPNDSEQDFQKPKFEKKDPGHLFLYFLVKI